MHIVNFVSRKTMLSRVDLSPVARRRILTPRILTKPPLVQHLRSYATPQTSEDLSVTIATPSTVFLDNVVVERVVVPGLEGQFEILPRLAATITELQPGVVTVMQKDS